MSSVCVYHEICEIDCSSLETTIINNYYIFYINSTYHLLFVSSNDL